MLELVASILELLSSAALNIQEFFFRRKREKRRKFEEENKLPKKRMISPFQRLDILLGVCLIIYIIGKVFVVPSIVSENKTNKRATEIKELLEKEKEVFGSYPLQLRIIKRGNPLRENLLIDGWGINFKYKIIKNSYSLTSAGKDGKFDTKDDIIF
jgi:general secretion pathway protein G